MRYLFPQSGPLNRTGRPDEPRRGFAVRDRTTCKTSGEEPWPRRELLTSEIGSVQRHSGSVVPLATTAHHHPLCSGTSGTAIPGQPQNRGIVTESLLLVFQD